MANASEKQLKKLVKHYAKFNSLGIITLRPQGDDTTISHKAINLCEVKTKSSIGFLFGGISEAFYDKLVRKYDSSFEHNSEDGVHQ